MLRLSLLGVIEMRGDDGASLEAPVRASKRIAVLAYLASARPHGFHRRDKVAAMFWPELPDDRARAALRTTLSRLREDTGAEVILGRGMEEIAIDTNLITCDVVAFDDAVAASNFAFAVACYRGPLLDGVHVEGTGEEFESWIANERQRLHDAALRALCALADAAEASSNRSAAIAHTKRALEMAPTDETIARRLIALRLATGDRGGAMHDYESLTRRLRREFDVEPSSETEQLIRDTQIARAPHEGVAPPTSLPVPGPGATPPERTRTNRKRWYAGTFLAAVAVVSIMAALWLGVRGSVDQMGTPTTVATPAPAVIWHRLRTEGEARPTPRVHGVVLLDSTGNALLLLGGIIARGESGDSSPALGDIWRLNGLSVAGAHRWTRLSAAPGPAPLPRWQALGAYDAAHDRAILHGGALGHSSPCSSETWILDRASGIGGAPRWGEVRVDGPLPPPRAHVQGFYEARTRSLVTFSGNDCFSTFSSDVWKLTFDDEQLRSGHWTHVRPDSSAGAPSRRNGDAVTYDPRVRRMWTHGGNIGSLHETSELWRLDHADGSDGAPSWHPVRCSGQVPALTSHVAAFDTTTGTLLVYGGINGKDQEQRDVWRVRGLTDGGSTCSWERLPTGDEAPLPRASARGAMLPNGSIVLLGGDIEGLALLDLWRGDRAP